MQLHIKSMIRQTSFGVKVQRIVIAQISKVGLRDNLTCLAVFEIVSVVKGTLSFNLIVGNTCNFDRKTCQF